MDLPDGSTGVAVEEPPVVEELPPTEIERIAAALAPLRFERLYGSWVERVVPEDAHAAVQRSAARYVEKIAAG